MALSPPAHLPTCSLAAAASLHTGPDLPALRATPDQVRGRLFFRERAREKGKCC